MLYTWEELNVACDSNNTLRLNDAENVRKHAIGELGIKEGDIPDYVVNDFFEKQHKKGIYFLFDDKGKVSAEVDVHKGLSKSVYLQLSDESKNTFLDNDWFGDGSCYKFLNKDWGDMDDETIIYVPEYAYEKDDFGNDIIADVFTKSDFVNIVSDYAAEDFSEDFNKLSQTEKNEFIEETAIHLFEEVEWQYPETLIDDDFIENALLGYLETKDEDKEEIEL